MVPEAIIEATLCLLESLSNFAFLILIITRIGTHIHQEMTMCQILCNILSMNYLYLHNKHIKCFLLLTSSFHQTKSSEKLSNCSITTYLMFVESEFDFQNPCYEPIDYTGCLCSSRRQDPCPVHLYILSLPFLLPLQR